jgi:hypothetical protein
MSNGTSFVFLGFVELDISSQQGGVNKCHAA